MTTFLVAAMAMAALTFVISREGYARRFVGLATPRPLAWVRILTSLLVIYYLLLEDLPRIAEIPAPLARWGHLLWFLEGTIPAILGPFQRDATALRVLQLGSVAVAALAMVGWRTRFTVPATAILAATCGALLRQYIGWAHLGAAAIYVMIVLSFLPSGDALSLDRRRRIRQGLAAPDEDSPTERHGWALHAFWATLTVIYLCAALSKLRERGFEWASATNMKWSLYKYVNVYPFDWQWDALRGMDGMPESVFLAMGCMGLLGELLFPLVLWSRWAKLIFPGLMIALHVAMYGLKNFIFLDCVVLLGAAAVIGWRYQIRWTSDRVSPPCRRILWATLVSGILVGQGVIWSTRCEAYPATGFMMYSSPPADGVSSSQRTIVRDASGTDSWVCLAGEGRTYYDNRLINKALSAAVDPRPHLQEAGVQYLELLVRRWNEKAEPERRILGLDTYRALLDATQVPDSEDWISERFEARFRVGPEGELVRVKLPALGAPPGGH